MGLDLEIDASELLAMVPGLQELPTSVFEMMRGNITDLMDVVRGDQALAIGEGLDLEGGVLKPNAEKYAAWKEKKFGVSKPLVREGVLGTYENWSVRPYTRKDRHEYFLTLKEPRERRGVSNWLKMRGWDKSFGMTDKQSEDADKGLNGGLEREMAKVFK